MKKKLTIILSLGCISLLCAGLAACAEDSEIEKLQKQGYKVSVTYDANGGAFLDRTGVTIMDMLKPTNYAQNAEGEYEIKLIEPEDTQRPTSSNEPITLTRSGYFYAGWYRNRTVVTNEKGNPVDEAGVELVEKDGLYYYANAEVETTATPAYTYDGYWDFENDVITYSEDDGIVEMTLYAGWVPYYEFDYYYQSGDKWVLFGSTNFDYKTTNAPESKTADKDTIWIPQWQDGAMSHSYKYNDGKPYEFPKQTGTTFSKAYTSKDCTPEAEIKESFEHTGTLDVAYGENKSLRVTNRVQDVYVVLEEGEQYRISTPDQLVKHATPDGWYEICNDLDFSELSSGLTWPTAFSAGAFRGKIYATEGQSYALKNVTVSHSSANTGGIFGTIAKGAEITNISFENATFDLAYMSTRAYTMFGLLAGNIETDAKLTGVTVGGVFKIGKVSLNSNDYDINLLANGETDGITVTEIKLQVYGEMLISDYNYSVNPETVAVDENGKITMTFVTQYRSAEASYDITINNKEE